MATKDGGEEAAPAQQKVVPATLGRITVKAPVAPPAAATVFEVLPAGWVKKISRSTGKFYYENESLQRTQWHRPGEPSPEELALRAARERKRAEEERRAAEEAEREKAEALAEAERAAAKARAEAKAAAEEKERAAKQAAAERAAKRARDEAEARKAAEEAAAARAREEAEARRAAAEAAEQAAAEAARAAEEAAARREAAGSTLENVVGVDAKVAGQLLEMHGGDFVKAVHAFAALGEAALPKKARGRQRGIGDKSGNIPGLSWTAPATSKSNVKDKACAPATAQESNPTPVSSFVKSLTALKEGSQTMPDDKVQDDKEAAKDSGDCGQEGAAHVQQQEEEKDKSEKEEKEEKEVKEETEEKEEKEEKREETGEKEEKDEKDVNEEKDEKDDNEEKREETGEKEEKEENEVTREEAKEEKDGDEGNMDAKQEASKDDHNTDNCELKEEVEGQCKSEANGKVQERNADSGEQADKDETEQKVEKEDQGMEKDKYHSEGKEDVGEEEEKTRKDTKTAEEGHADTVAGPTAQPTAAEEGADDKADAPKEEQPEAKLEPEMVLDGYVDPLPDGDKLFRNGLFRFTCVFSTGSHSGTVRRFQLRSQEVIKFGRFGKSDFVLTHASASTNHLEFKLVPVGSGGIAESGLSLSVRDVSSNGSGIEAPDAPIARLTKNTASLVQDSSLVVLPLVSKKNSEPRVSFRIHFGVGLVPCAPVPSPSCDNITTCAPEYHPPVIEALEAPEDKKDAKAEKPSKDQKGKKDRRAPDEPKEKAGRSEKCAEDSRGRGKDSKAGRRDGDRDRKAVRSRSPSGARPKKARRARSRSSSGSRERALQKKKARRRSASRRRASPRRSASRSRTTQPKKRRKERCRSESS